MNILITQQKDNLFEDFFPEFILEEINKLGKVRLNELGRTMTAGELAERLQGIEICITHAWHGCPKFTAEVLERAKHLKLIAHVGASVGSHITDEVYQRGIKVCSANRIMARYVAEGALGYMLSDLRQIPQHHQEIKEGTWRRLRKSSLINKKVSFVGLGTAGRYLIEMLRPFDAEIRIYDPYITHDSLIDLHGAQLVSSLKEALSWGDVITIHASKTPETYHMLNQENLKYIKDGALLINTARGALIDEQALCHELSTRRFSAVLDVFEKEPLPLTSPLRTLGNVILQPHCAGNLGYPSYTLGMVGEIRRYQSGEALQYEIPHKQFKLMTK